MLICICIKLIVITIDNCWDRFYLRSLVGGFTFQIDFIDAFSIRFLSDFIRL